MVRFKVPLVVLGKIAVHCLLQPSGNVHRNTNPRKNDNLTEAQARAELAEGDEKSIDRWSGYVAKVQGGRVVTPKDVDEKIDAALASREFRESLMKMLESVEVTALSQEIDKTRKEIRNLNRRLSKLEKKGKPSGTRRQ